MTHLKSLFSAKLRYVLTSHISKHCCIMQRKKALNDGIQLKTNKYITYMQYTHGLDFLVNLTYYCSWKKLADSKSKVKTLYKSIHITCFCPNEWHNQQNTIVTWKSLLFIHFLYKEWKCRGSCWNYKNDVNKSRSTFHFTNQL